MPNPLTTYAPSNAHKRIDLASVHLTIPLTLKRDMMKHRNINWSAVFRLAVQDRLRKERSNANRKGY